MWNDLSVQNDIALTREDYDVLSARLPHRHVTDLLYPMLRFVGGDNVISHNPYSGVELA